MRKPHWETITLIQPDGWVLLASGEMVRTIAFAEIAVGDSVLVYDGRILRFDHEPKGVFEPTEGGAVIRDYIFFYSMLSGVMLFYGLKVENNMFVFELQQQNPQIETVFGNYYNCGWDIQVHPDSTEHMIPRYDYQWTEWLQNNNYIVHAARLQNQRFPDDVADVERIITNDKELAIWGYGRQVFSFWNSPYYLFLYGEEAIERPGVITTVGNRTVGSMSYYCPTDASSKYFTLKSRPEDFDPVMIFEYPYGQPRPDYTWIASGRKPYFVENGIRYIDLQVVQYPIVYLNRPTYSYATAGFEETYVEVPAGVASSIAASAWCAEWGPYPPQPMMRLYTFTYNYTREKKFHSYRDEGIGHRSWQTHALLENMHVYIREYQWYTQNYSWDSAALQYSPIDTEGVTGDPYLYRVIDRSNYTYANVVGVLGKDNALFVQVTHQPGSEEVYGHAKSHYEITGYYSMSGLGRSPTDIYYSPPAVICTGQFAGAYPALNVLYINNWERSSDDNQKTVLELKTGCNDASHTWDTLSYINSYKSKEVDNKENQIVFSFIGAYGYSVDATGEYRDKHNKEEGTQCAHNFRVKGFDNVGDDYAFVYERYQSTLEADHRWGGFVQTPYLDTSTAYPGSPGSVGFHYVYDQEEYKSVLTEESEYYICYFVGGVYHREKLLVPPPGDSKFGYTAVRQWDGITKENISTFDGNFMTGFACQAAGKYFVYTYIVSTYADADWKAWVEAWRNNAQGSVPLYETPLKRVVGIINISDPALEIGYRQEFTLDDVYASEWPVEVFGENNYAWRNHPNVNKYSWKDLQAIGIHHE